VDIVEFIQCTSWRKCDNL